MQQAEIFCVVRNNAVDLYTRGWCVVEILEAMKLGMVPDRCKIAGPEALWSAQDVRAENLECHPADKVRLLRYLLQHQDEEINNINTTIKRFRHFMLGE